MTLAPDAGPERAIPRFVSVDDHVVEPPHVWQRWLPARFRERGPRVVASPVTSTYRDGRLAFALGGDGPPTDVWLFAGGVFPIPQVMACAGFPPEALTMDPIRFEAMRPGCHEPKARLADMDANHTEASLCFPTIPRFCGQLFHEQPDRELGLACVRAYNDWMVDEWCGDSGGRLIPLCLVPLWDPVAAAEEVRRNAARGVRAVTFSELPANLGLPSIHTGHWDPLFAACEETSTVVCMHIGSGSKMPTSSPDAPPGVTIALTFANAQTSLADWLLSGVLARFPRLRIAYSESQIGWIPFLLERVDALFHRSRAWAGLDPAITEPPSHYFRGRVYGCFFDDAFGVRARRDVGLEQITFEIDYPHQDSTWPHSADLVRTFARDLTDDELRMIVRDNALRMLGREPGA
ncbi:MAG: amidohydrolase [Myxococcales bacterium]|nr:amidohydrolase [Myxococcales bacterium]